MFNEISIRTSSGRYTLMENSVLYNGSDHLYFYYENTDEVAEVYFQVKDSLLSDSIYRIMPSGDYDIIDPLVIAGDRVLRMKVRFSNLNNSNFLRFQVMEYAHDSTLIHEIPLLSLTNTEANFFPLGNELFLGEEKIYELVSNHPQNIAVDINWIETENFRYRIEKEFEQPFIHVVPTRPGIQTLKVALKTKTPYINEEGELSNTLVTISKDLKVLESRLAFLSASVEELSFTASNRKEGMEIQLDDSPKLSLGKTYRIENQEEAGGSLIAELFPKSRMSNNKVLCLLRVYNLHKSSDGYLYIKNGDQPVNLTNFNISPELHISRIQVLKEGENWSEKLQVYPGETFEVKINGEGLHNASFFWNNATDLTADSTMKTENVAFFRLKIPVNVSAKRISLFNRGEDTGKALNIKEYQEPRNFDFVTLNYGTGDKTITELGGPVIQNKVIKDILIDFDYNKIDSENKLFGKQYMEVDVKITGRKNELIELKTIPMFAVCPGELSPRHPYYYKKDCVNSGISLNKYLSRKTYDLDEWVRIQLTFKHINSKYESRGAVQTVEIIVQKDYRFDVDVSFPAGLIIKRFGSETDAYDNFGGISMAMIAQFSFYDQERIGKLKPYKIGAGFLALNAFNFNEGVDRDVAIVVLGSLYPTRKDVKLTFPLYIGTGYFLGAQKFFIVLGPGIRISL